MLRLLQRGASLGLPHSRPMPVIGSRCHELRIQDENRTWRIVYRVDAGEERDRQLQEASPTVGRE
jgi:hypothetical protein